MKVFNQVVASGSKHRGYYDDRYWSHVNVSQDPTFVCQSVEEHRTIARAEAAEKKVHQMSDMMNHWLALLRQKFPEEDWQNGLQAIGNDEVTIHQPFYLFIYSHEFFSFSHVS